MVDAPVLASQYGKVELLWRGSGGWGCFKATDFGAHIASNELIVIGGCCREPCDFLPDGVVVIAGRGDQIIDDQSAGQCSVAIKQTVVVCGSDMQANTDIGMAAAGDWIGIGRDHTCP